MSTDESMMWPRKQHLKEVIRSVIVLKPKQPFVDWANQFVSRRMQVTLEDARRDCPAILVPFIGDFKVQRSEEWLLDWFASVGDAVFQKMLNQYSEDRRSWPDTEDFATFRL